MAGRRNWVGYLTNYGGDSEGVDFGVCLGAICSLALLLGICGVGDTGILYFGCLMIGGGDCGGGCRMIGVFAE
jgi:hypothetical protein